MLGEAGGEVPEGGHSLFPKGELSYFEDHPG